jgi:hypothetical protein
MNGRPGALVLDIPTKFLEAETTVRSTKQIDTSVVRVVLDTFEDEPIWVEAP